MALKLNGVFFEISAFADINVENAFTAVVRELMRSNPSDVTPSQGVGKSRKRRCLLL
jgi:hypothetical protein